MSGIMAFFQRHRDDLGSIALVLLSLSVINLQVRVRDLERRK